MQDELEIQARDILTRLARAGGRTLDVDLPVAKRGIRGFDQFQDGLTAGNDRFGRVCKDGITFQFMDGQQLFDLHTDRFKQIAKNFMGVIELGPRNERSIARNIGEKQITVLRNGAHGLMIQDWNCRDYTSDILDSLPLPGHKTGC